MATITFTGVVGRKRMFEGSNSEHDAIVLEIDNGPVMKIRIKGSHPFEEPALESYIGKRVSIKGKTVTNMMIIFIDGLSDVAVQTLPVKTARPPQP
jgi:hypothetical protein